MNKNLITQTLIFVLVFFTSVNCLAQGRSCGMTEHMNQQMQDPDFAREYEKNQEKFREALEKNIRTNGSISNRLNPIIIPVAVHFPAGQETDRVCLEALAQTQIDILNADYSATNSDASLWNSASSNYPGVVHGATNIEFCIATLNHPTDFAGNPIEPDIVEGGPAVTIGYNFGNGNDSDSNWSGYMNFLVKNAGGGILGYSPLGGSIGAGQSVVISPSAFGSGSGCTGYSPGSPFNLGRTVTHELGHFYNLNHTFSGSCNTDDGIADTPNISQPNYGCSAPGSISGCVNGESALTMSYMDYGNDSCLYMFSEGQTDIVDNYISGVLESQFRPNAVSCGEPENPDYFITSLNSPYSTCGDEAVFSLSYSTTGGFNSDVSLSVLNVPSNTTSSLSQTSIDTDGNFTLTLSNISNLGIGDFIVTVRALENESEYKETDVVLSIVNSLCESAGDMTYFTATTGVIFNTIYNLDATLKTVPYSDFTDISTDVIIGSNYDLTIKVNTDGNYQAVSKVWIDWNQNCSFDDPGEEYDMGMTAGTEDGPTGNSPLAVIIPDSALLGSTTMRVSTKYTDPNEGQYATSCQVSYDGEVEDYTVNVMAALSVYTNVLDSLLILPNPNNGSFTLELKSNTSNDISVNIYDIRGREIHNQVYISNGDFKQSIELGNIESGLYLVMVLDGERKTTKRIIVE